MTRPRGSQLANSTVAALQSIVEDVLRATKSSRVTLRLEDAAYGIVAEAIVPGVQSLKSLPPPADVRADPVARQVFDEQVIVVVDRTATHELVHDDPRGSYQIKAEIVAPISSEGRCVGALSVHDVSRARRWTARQALAVSAATKRVEALITEPMSHDSPR